MECIGVCIIDVEIYGIKKNLRFRRFFDLPEMDPEIRAKRTAARGRPEVQDTRRCAGRVLVLCTLPSSCASAQACSANRIFASAT